MKVGYACINQSLKCRSSRTFRLKNFSEKRLIDTVEGNLNCLTKILEFNREKNIFFFRITSDLIPFASHPVMKFDWQDYFKQKLEKIGRFIKSNQMRITMHPGQYTLLNSKNPNVFENSLKDLEYHAEVLDLLKLENNAKIEIHVGGVYGDKKKSMSNFIKRYENLENKIRKRLIIENDDKSYSLADNLIIHKECGIPLTFDIYHHKCLNGKQNFNDSFEDFIKTWNKDDGIPIVHYSSEHSIKGKCRHAETIDINDFKEFIKKTKNYDFDLMLEIKDKQISALKAIDVVLNDPRFNVN